MRGLAAYQRTGERESFAFGFAPWRNEWDIPLLQDIIGIAALEKRMESGQPPYVDFAVWLAWDRRSRGPIGFELLFPLATVKSKLENNLGHRTFRRGRQVGGPSSQQRSCWMWLLSHRFQDMRRWWRRWYFNGFPAACFEKHDALSLRDRG